MYGDGTEAARWFEKVLTLDPRYVRAFDHLAWAARDQRHYGDMLSWGRLAAERLPDKSRSGLLLAQAEEAAGQRAQAERTLHGVRERLPQEWETSALLAELHWRAGEDERAETELAPLLASERPLSDRRRGLRALAQMEGRRGRFTRVFLRLDQISELSRHAGDADEAARPIAEKAFWLAFVRNDPAQARIALDASMSEQRHLLAVMPFAYEVALKLGQQDRARTLGSEVRGYRSLAEAEAFARSAEGRRDDAIRILGRLARRGSSAEQVLWSYQVALWALEEKRPDTAVEFLLWMQRAPPAPVNYPPWPEHTGEQDALYAPSFFLLGKALELRGDTRQAREAYSRFLELWRDADPDVVEPIEARARLLALTGDGAADLPTER